MYIGTAVLTVLCIWFTDSSCFRWTRPIANVHFCSQRSICASRMPWAPCVLDLWPAHSVCVVEHMYSYFCLEDTSQKLPRQQFTLPRAGGREFATLLVSEALVVQLHLLLKFWKWYTGRKNIFSLFNKLNVLDFFSPPFQVMGERYFKGQWLLRMMRWSISKFVFRANVS